MEKRKLGKTDILASVIGFGGIPIQRLSFNDAERVLKHAYEHGINFFDTARAYTDSEEKMGQALRDVRDRIILASKALSRDADGMRKELETSLRNLKTDMIDLYQIHSLSFMHELEQVLKPGGAYEALLKAKEEGKVRWIGVTGHSRPVLQKAVYTGNFDTIQLPFNPIEDEWAEDVIPAAKEAGMGTIGMKPLAGGALRNTSTSIRFSLTRGIDISIPGMDSVEQVDANIAAGEELKELSREELEKLEDEKKTWEGEFCRRCAYCMPCPQGLNIPFLLLIEAYYTRYDLKDWALARLNSLEKKFSDCTACEECLERCPYNLPIPEIMARAAKTVI